MPDSPGDRAPAVRPAVSVVVPFHGDRRHAEETLSALARLELRDGDELVIADNTADTVMAELLPDGAVIVPVPVMRSSYSARNAGAGAAAGEWLLFIDSDCVPCPSLLDEYFREPIRPEVGAVAGEVVAASGQDALAARYSRSRRHIGQAEIRDHPHRAMAVTANLLVRRSTWVELAGFHEGIRSGGDADFCWRLQDAGWTLGYVPEASVEHRHRETVRALLRQSARYGAGMRWLTRRHPEATFGGIVRPLARCAVAIPVLLVTGRFERALFKALDALWIAASAGGSLASNVHPRSPEPAGVALVTGLFPEAEAAARARALREAGDEVRIEAAGRPFTGDRPVACAQPISYLEDDGPGARVRDLVWLSAHRPFRAARDLTGRRTSEASPLRVLAPSARRLATAGVARIHACGRREDAARLAQLLGVPFTADAY